MNVDYMNFESEGHVVLSTNAVLCSKPSTMYSKKRSHNTVPFYYLIPTTTPRCVLNNNSPKFHFK